MSENRYETEFDSLDDLVGHKDWSERLYLQNLKNIELYLNKDGHGYAGVLEDLLDDTVEYLGRLADTPINSEIIEKFNEIKTALYEQFLKDKTEKFSQAIAIGQFIEALIFYGMPRRPAIEATAEWLSIGISTARTHNELFRKTYSHLETHATLNMSAGQKHIFKQLDRIEHFPRFHPKAGGAIEGVNAFYLKKRKIDEIIQSKRRKEGEIYHMLSEEEAEALGLNPENQP